MYDFHSHILPGIDDGSRNVDESLAMLREMSQQGITHLALTPHFYPDRANPIQFLKKRQLSWQRLAPKLERDMPKIKLGAEVYYFEGLYLSDDILSLCLEDTSLLLLEMPFSKWSTRMVNHIIELNGRQNLQILLAHFERYLPYQSKSTWDTLLQNGILIQSNADFFLDRFTRRTAMKMLKNGNIHVLGSDCHNMVKRKPNLGSAMIAIEKKLGARKIEELHSYGSRLFDGDWKVNI